MQIDFNLSRLITCFCKMTSFILLADENDTNNLMITMNMFLNYYDEFDQWLKHINTSDKEPRIIRMFNFINLLLTPEQIKHLGNVKFIRDGKYLGEKVIQPVKHMFNNMKGDWHTETLQKLHQDKLIK